MNSIYERKVDKERLIKSIGIVSKSQTSSEVEESLKKMIRISVSESAKFCMAVNENEITNFLDSKNSEFENLMNRLMSGFFMSKFSTAHGRLIVKNYADLRRECKELTDIKRQESELDYSNRRRFLIFRFLTGLSFAIIICVTSYVANHFGIPLPMSNLDYLGKKLG
jgi:hypothetical protein